ncbi:hypothetical protein HK104_004986, partial [Borealophlyctis nickersoniae]
MPRHLTSLSAQLLQHITLHLPNPLPFIQTCRLLHDLGTSHPTRRAWLRVWYPRLPLLGEEKEFEFLDDASGYAAPGFGAGMCAVPVLMVGDEVLRRMVEEWGVYKGILGGGDVVREEVPGNVSTCACAGTQTRTNVTVGEGHNHEPALSFRLLLRLCASK